MPSPIKNAAILLVCAGLMGFPAASPAQTRWPLLVGPALGHAFGLQPAGASRALRTPLPQKTLELLANEVSGQVAFNNEVLLAGAPVLREESEFAGTFFETQKLLELARAAGLDNARIFRYPSDQTFDYARQAELWVVKPAKRLIARLEADPALVAEGSASADTTAELIYVPPPGGDQVRAWLKAGPQAPYQGKVALMWSHPQRDAARALDAAGILGVISFSSEDRYFDPDQVIYERGPYSRMKNMKFGLTVSWRQWSELLEDTEHGESVTVRCRVAVSSYPDRFEGVLASIPGTEPRNKGLIFTAHLFEDYTKRGANDDMSGVVAELEVARALCRLIKQGDLPQPRRTITFLWTNEIGGTFEYIKHTPGLADSLSADINMDMVGEGLRQNNAVFILTEAPNARPTYFDGLGRSILNYIWRTNDIVYLPDSPRPARSEQVFPLPLWEKNGSRDAFRFDVQPVTGGSDHICFTNPSTAVPAVSLNIWPDQWYHSDRDVPDKSDPTQLRRAAFAGAAMVWAAAYCTDEVLGGLAEAVEDFAYSRVARRELPAALKAIRQASAEDLGLARRRARNLIALGIEREQAALETMDDIRPASESARKLVADTVERWKFYARELEALVDKAAELRARELKRTGIPPIPQTPLEKKSALRIPYLTENVKGKEFRVEQSPLYRDYLKAHPKALEGLRLRYAERRALLDYANGRRSLAVIRDRAESETGTRIRLEDAVRYMDFLQTIGWVAYRSETR